MGSSDERSVLVLYIESRGFILPVRLIMTADVQQDNFLIGNDDGQGDAIAVDDADGLNAFKLAAGMVIGKMGGKGTLRQVLDDFCKPVL